MLIIPPGHAETLRTRRRLSPREIWMISGVASAVVVLAIVLVISLASSGPGSKSGCIYATIPAATGAQQLHECGAQARDTCQSVFAAGAYTHQAAQAIASECRKAGLPVGSSNRGLASLGVRGAVSPGVPARRRGRDRLGRARMPGPYGPTDAAAGGPSSPKPPESR